MTIKFQTDSKRPRSLPLLLWGPIAATSIYLASCSGGSGSGDNNSSSDPPPTTPDDPNPPSQPDPPNNDGVIAFATAEGFGKNALGGRGGKILKVTNLNDSGTGSLRAAVEDTGPRTVVFEVAGTILLRSPLTIREDRITIAGQTAPGGGICLRDDRLEVKADDVIIRHLRTRPGDVAGQSAASTIDALSITGGKNIIIDHVSATWGIDECLSVGGTDTDLLSVQWCLIAEGLADAGHPSGNHSRGSLIRGANGARFSFHHNLWAHCDKRMPELQALRSPSSDSEGLFVDLRNNVMFNWGGDEAGFNLNSNGQIARYNFVNNHYQAGINSDPRTVSSFPFVAPPAIFDEQSGSAQGHFEGNWFDGSSIGDDYDQVETGGDVNRSSYRSTGRHSTSGFTVSTSDGGSAYAQVTDKVGANLPRDTVDQRIVAEVLADIGFIIDSQDQVGGWPFLATGSPPTDADNDGMADDWEIDNGLSPAVRDHNGEDLKAGYTNIEHYLAFRAGESL